MKINVQWPCVSRSKRPDKARSGIIMGLTPFVQIIRLSLISINIFSNLISKGMAVTIQSSDSMNQAADEWSTSKDS